MMLVERGRIGLNNPVVNYLPYAPDGWKEMTVRHPVTHTSGLASLRNDFRALRPAGWWQLDYSTNEAFNAITAVPLDFRPGTRYQYSDEGYFVLGIIIEAQSGQWWRDFVTEHIFQPLGMTNTSVIDLWKVIKNRAGGYTWQVNALACIRRDFQFELPSFYGILSSVTDLVKWDAALYGSRLLTQSSLAQNVDAGAIAR